MIYGFFDVLLTQVRGQVNVTNRGCQDANRLTWLKPLLYSVYQSATALVEWELISIGISHGIERLASKCLLESIHSVSMRALLQRCCLIV